MMKKIITELALNWLTKQGEILIFGWSRSISAEEIKRSKNDIIKYEKSAGAVEMADAMLKNGLINFRLEPNNELKCVDLIMKIKVLHLRNKDFID